MINNESFISVFIVCVCGSVSGVHLPLTTHFAYNNKLIRDELFRVLGDRSGRYPSIEMQMQVQPRPGVAGAVVTVIYVHRFGAVLAVLIGPDPSRLRPLNDASPDGTWVGLRDFHPHGAPSRKIVEEGIGNVFECNDAPFRSQVG